MRPSLIILTAFTCKLIMASIVTEVLSTAGRLETQEVQSKLEVLTKKVDDLKLQVHEVIHGKYVDFYPNLTTSNELAKNLDQVSEEMQEVADKIENEIKSQLNMSTNEFQSLSSQLQEVMEILAVLEKLVQLQENLECISLANKTKNFSQAAEAVLSIQKLLIKCCEDYGDVKILMALQTECHVQKEKFMFDLGNKWKEMIAWNITEETASVNQKCELKMVIDGENANVINAVIVAMDKLDILDDKLKIFGSRLVKYMLKPCITDSNTVIEGDLSQSPLTIIISCPKKTSEAMPEPRNLFSKLVYIFESLNKRLLHLSIESGETTHTLMEALGSLISQEILDLIVKNCLLHAIPSNHKELEGFKQVLNDTEIFHEKLIEMKFINQNNTILLDFIQNVNVLFANKKCQEILEKARHLMTTEIHNTVRVSEDKPLGELPPLGQDGASVKKSRKLELAAECRLSNNTFRLPACHISVCIQELLSLAYETLQEATESSPQCAIQMFFAVRNMFELYCGVFPTYHKKSLATLPQTSAIFHNNCMFIAHHLMTLGHQFCKKLPSINPTFVDLVPKIRSLGAEYFMQQLSTQKDQMTECLEGAKGFVNLSAEESTYFDAERAINQILHQFQHLQKVWQEVLPPNIYRKAIGSLLNSVMTDIVSSIVVIEDISSDDARQLASLLSRLQDKSGPLLIIPGDDSANITAELQKNVPKWLRFKEMITLLNASLLEINDRWADGKGPLAVEFSANEVKQMIRALFQNTDRRSAILTKIR